jgi:hypothetical protein
VSLEIHVQGTVFTDNSTISMVSIEGVFQCYLLEDTIREVPGQPVETWKIFGKTAIPRGRYQVVRTMSARFGRVLPLLLKVPGYVGARIHPGNTPKDTEGCLLPGFHKGEDVVTESRAAFELLDKKIEEALAAGEEVWITLEGVPE